MPRCAPRSWPGWPAAERKPTKQKPSVFPRSLRLERKQHRRLPRDYNTLFRNANMHLLEKRLVLSDYEIRMIATHDYVATHGPC